MAKEIKLSKGYIALVDDEDFEWLSKFKWHIGGGYAIRTAQNDFKQITVRMHREILQAPKGLEVDHVNKDKLDNRRQNLRLASKSQNARNRGANKNNTSGFKGVSWNKRDNKWQALIRVHLKKKFLGYFDDPTEAAKAYDKAAKELHEEFANTNFN
jgi:HNH endonuclease/AP2 domain